MRTKQKGKMTFTGTSNASSSGLQRTGSEISDSKISSLSDDLCSPAVCLCTCHLLCVAFITCRSNCLVACVQSGSLTCLRQCTNTQIFPTHVYSHQSPNVHTAAGERVHHSRIGSTNMLACLIRKKHSQQCIKLYGLNTLIHSPAKCAYGQADNALYLLT